MKKFLGYLILFLLIVGLLFVVAIDVGWLFAICAFIYNVVKIQSL